ncbi:hypothetical protein Lalb_Chr19g0126811 [Lupinus albus]|uniref:Uncharacterized protein n=1 Tax=Lupinus albus TaxID=3870 RepID=A0A6A4NSQ4_LUPAL|nr:hypothetical protein Lalb_Chr19g0126811 [Lupinus albus]
MKTPTHGGVEKPKEFLIRILKESLAISPYAMKLSSSNAPSTTFWNHIFRHH